MKISDVLFPGKYQESFKNFREKMLGLLLHQTGVYKGLAQEPSKTEKGRCGQMNQNIERIISGKCSRSEILRIRENATNIIKIAIDRPDKESEAKAKEANEELLACDSHMPEPSSSQYNFMGFCPGDDVKRRRDTMWREQGICYFDFEESKGQVTAFSLQVPGDWIILKKIKECDKTMSLYGFGKITKRHTDDIKFTYFDVKWNTQSEEILVPLMGCNSNINMKTLERVEKTMDKEFWIWLSHPFN